MKITRGAVLVMAQSFVALTLLTSRSWAATRGDLHVAVYASGFVVDSQRQVTYGDQARRVQIKTKAQGTASGEMPDSGIEIDRLDQGVLWKLDPKSKTYSSERYQSSRPDKAPSEPQASAEPPTLKISKMDPTVTGPIGSATINGLPCQSYTIRIVADFTNPQTGKVVATETLFEKLWVTEKAPEIVKFRKAEDAFREKLTTSFGTERANFRWLIRELNKMILEAHGNNEDFLALQRTYQGARASINGVTVRQLAGWNWWAKDPDAPGAGQDINTLVGAIAAGLGAPPEEGKPGLTEANKPAWVQDLEKDLGRTGSSAMILEEVVKARSVNTTSNFFEVPEDYRKL